MKIRFNKVLVTLILVLSAFTPMLFPATTFACSAASDTSDTSGSASQVLGGVGSTGVSCNSGGVNDLISTIINILSLVAGIVAIVMIVVAALRFITSGGDSNKVAAAKSALIYALIGLAIAAMAQALVHFALSTATNAVTTNKKS